MKKITYEERTYKEIPESMAIKQSDDAWHPLRNPNYIEWWYFDVMNSDGGIVRGHFYISGNISRSRSVRTGVRATYVKPDGTELTIERKLPYSSFKASTDVCAVEIGKNYLRGNLSRYELHIEDNEKTLDLELDSKITGFTSHAYYGDEKRYMYWTVPQPRGHAKGTFRTKQRNFEIEGVAYRDHNWLNFMPPDFIAYWDWGRIYDEEFTVIFADIVTSKRLENVEIKPLLLYDSQGFLYLTSESKNWSLTKAGGNLDPVTGIEVPETFLLRAHDGILSLDIDLKLERVFQRIDPLADFNPLVRWFIRTFRAKPSITSFFSVGSGRLSFTGHEKILACKAVHELVRNQ